MAVRGPLEPHYIIIIANCINNVNIVRKYRVSLRAEVFVRLRVR